MIVRRHNNLSQNCSQLYEIKILNFKEFDEQLELTWPRMKNELFETTKKVKEFKFEHNLRLEFKQEGVLNETIFVHPWLDW